jgi:anaerobic magnesium-protoporphyrin IX monomethyl ester cyclase
MGRPMRVLLVDLNQFARFPTLAIGYLVASLRKAGVDVEVLSPLKYGVPGKEREWQERRRDQLKRRVALSGHPAVARSRDFLRQAHSRRQFRPHPEVVRQTQLALDNRRPDALLLSAYLDYYPSVVAIAKLAHQRDVPVLLGGPMFNIPEITREWLDIPGLSAVVGAEVDYVLPDIVRALVSHEDLTRFPGVFLPDGQKGPPAIPLGNLEALPVPDFTDFPWESYPHRVLPIMTGRGCSWGRCLFCGDVKTANGRGFRSRSVDAVFAELRELSDRHNTRDVLFHDIKLNSDLTMWRGIIERYQHELPGGRWIGTVHVAARGDNGLTARDLHAARAAGMLRTTFGLESGSQRLNTRMAKGTSMERMSQFIRDASGAGISVRTSIIVGYPGETARDVDETVRFVETHEAFLDRISMARFKAIPGTRFHEFYERTPERYRDLLDFSWNPRYGRAHYQYAHASQRSHRRSTAHLIRLVHRINSKPLRHEAQPFMGLM